SEGVIKRLMEYGAQMVAAKGLDLSEPEGLLKHIAGFGLVHIVVINPGWFGYKSFMETSIAEWEQALARNYEQGIYALQAAAKYLIDEGNGGRIVILSSMSAVKPLMYMSAVGTSLAALHGLARMAAVDLGPYGITVNVVAVGWTGREPAAILFEPQLVEPGIPVGRIGMLEDVADVCCFLASDVADYITGQIIQVDGG